MADKPNADSLVPNPESNGGPTSSSLDTTLYKAQGKTDSMIVADRSKSVAAHASVESYEARKVALMAGPMLDWDPIYLVNLVISVLSTALAGAGVFMPYTFTSHSRIINDPRTFSLFDSMKCDKKSTASYQSVVCFGEKNTLGDWVLGAQILCPAGFALNVINLILQVVNLCFHHRKYSLHMGSMYCMALSGVLMLVGGHLLHHNAIWQSVVQLSREQFVRVEPLSSGLFLLSVMLACWCCVLTHVSSHGPGPVSANTRFLHTYDEELPVAPPLPLLPPVQPQLQEILVEPQPDERKASVVSTSV